jgi:RHS repeat-associated protein
VVGLTNGNGALTDTYSAFGLSLKKTGTSTQPYRYLGNVWDPDARLLDFHARAYEQTTGRFTSKDPISGFAQRPQSLNPYAYGLGGPLAYPDPYDTCVLV